MKYIANENFILKEIADEKILVPRGEEAIDFGAMVVFNETGILIWENLSTPKTFSEIVKIVTEKYNVTFEKVADDISTFLVKSVKEGFILESEEA